MAHVKSLTPAQLTVLRELAAHGSLPRSALMTAAAIGHNTMATVFEALEYRGLVIEGERPKGRALCLIEITMAGRLALADTEAGTYTDLTRVPPPTRQVVAIPILPRPPFYRNNGLAHIPSRGVAC